jgi:hypothetical protein
MQCRVYDSKTIETMGWAFDKAFEDLSEGSKHRPSVQRNLALSIIRFFYGGEGNPLQLCRMASAINAFSYRKRTNSEGMVCSRTSRIVIPLGFEKWPVAF